MSIMDIYCRILSRPARATASGGKNSASSNYESIYKSKSNSLVLFLVRSRPFDFTFSLELKSRNDFF
jgi:hypothetical protein